MKRLPTFLACIALWACGDDAAEHDGAVDASDAAVGGDSSDGTQADAAERDGSAVDVAADGDAGMTDDAGADGATGLPYPIRLGVPRAVSQACGVAADPAGNVYVVGQTNGPLGGNAPLGRRDLFLARVRASGALHWVRQIGDSGTGLGIFAGGCAVAVGEEGEAYVAGTANGTGSFQGQPLPSVYAGFVARFDSDGPQRWIRLIGEAPGPTELMAVEAHAGKVHVLGWSEAALNGQLPRGQGDAVLVRLQADTGAVLKTLRFGGAEEDVPMGLARDADGLWVGFRRSEGRSSQKLGHELVHLGVEDKVLHQISAPEEPNFSVIAYAVAPAGDVLLLGATAGDESQGYAFRAHLRDGTLGPIVAGTRAGSLQARAISCGPASCAIAGQVLEESQTGQDVVGILGFVHLYTPQLEPGPRANIVGQGGSFYTAVAALAPAPNGHWFAAGWSGATLWRQPPVGPTDGIAFRVSASGEVMGSP